MLSNDVDAAPDGSSVPAGWLYLEEVTHRVLNEYTVMIAMLRRATKMVLDKNAETTLNEISDRLRTAATYIRALRPPTDRFLRDISRELEPLCESLSNSIRSYGRIELVLSSEPVAISAYRCWQLSLIISELVTNAARHAFRTRDDGLINVLTAVRGGNIECAVLDNGRCEPTFTPGRGTAIVNTLVGDFGGAITRSQSINGSAIVFSIPLAEAFFTPTTTQATRSPARTAIRLPNRRVTARNLGGTERRTRSGPSDT